MCHEKNRGHPGGGRLLEAKGKKKGRKKAWGKREGGSQKESCSYEKKRLSSRGTEKSKKGTLSRRSKKSVAFDSGKKGIENILEEGGNGKKPLSGKKPRTAYQEREKDMGGGGWVWEGGEWKKTVRSKEKVS